MPLPLLAAGAIHIIARQVIMALTTGAIVTGGQEILDGTAKKLVKEIQDSENVTEETAKDIVGDIFLDLAINSASIMAVLKTGLGVKAATYLGLTSKGFIKKPLASTAAATLKKVSGPWEKFKAFSLMSKILTLTGVGASSIWLANTFVQAVEPGIYKPRETNNLWEKFTGIRPFPEDPAALRPGPFSATSSVTFSDFAKSLEAQGVVGFLHPIKLQSIPYSREDLASIVDYVYGEAILKGYVYSVKDLVAKIAPFLVVANQKQVTFAGGTTSQTNTPSVKVFTGIVSQGVVGEGLQFIARPDDLIENVAELRTAAVNNLAPFLAALPAKVVYEVKVVPSIITKDGFKQTGTAQKIQTGTFANGDPKYKTVINKFATLVLYVFTDKGTRTKISTIVLGPVDSAKLRVEQNDLRALETELPKIVTTSNTKDVANIIQVPAKTENKIVAPVPVEIPKIITGTPVAGYKYYEFEVNKEKYYEPIFQPFYGDGLHKEIPFEDFLKGLNTIIATDPERASWVYDLRKSSAVAFGGGTAPAVSANSANITKAGANATTLREWYQSQGQALPSLEARSKIYAGFSLGQASYYTGTSEQNTKLLNALKST